MEISMTWMYNLLSKLILLKERVRIYRLQLVMQLWKIMLPLKELLRVSMFLIKLIS